jgi:hypothetical protein
MSRHPCKPPIVTAALSKPGKERVPIRVHLEWADLRQFQGFLVLQFQAVVIDVRVFRCCGPHPAFTWLPGRLPAILQYHADARTERQNFVDAGRSSKLAGL